MDEFRPVPRHWLERAPPAEARAGRGAPLPIASWSRRALFVIGATALGHMLWTTQGSGTPLEQVDVMHALEDSPRQDGARVAVVPLNPAMNPLRALLHVTRSSIGSSRLGYEVRLLEPDSGAVLWESTGILGSHQDEAALMISRESLQVFEVARAGNYGLSVRATGSTMDDLRTARIELRRNVSRMDGRLLWGLAGGALLSLATLLGSRWLGSARRW